jgi:hypothetical protein
MLATSVKMTRQSKVASKATSVNKKSLVLTPPDSPILITKVTPSRTASEAKKTSQTRSSTAIKTKAKSVKPATKATASVTKSKTKSTTILKTPKDGSTDNSADFLVPSPSLDRRNVSMVSTLSTLSPTGSSAFPKLAAAVSQNGNQLPLSSVPHGMAAISSPSLSSGTSVTSAALSSFGISAGIPVPQQTYGRNVYIKMCIVRGHGGNFNIVFRFQHQNPTAPCWPEKHCNDAVAKNRPEWVTMLNIDPRTLVWYDENVLMENDRKYGVKLFVIRAAGNVPAKQHLVELAQHIAAQLNNTRGNNTTTFVDEQSLFWKTENAVWSDVIGFDESLRSLLEETDTVHPFPGFYETNRDIILTYFHTGTFSQELASLLHAPASELHPSIRPFIRPETLNDDDVGSDDDDDSFIDNDNYRNTINLRRNNHSDNDDDDDDDNDYGNDDDGDDE